MTTMQDLRANGKIARTTSAAGYEPPPDAPPVFWAVPLERNIQDVAVESLLDMAMWCGMRKYNHIRFPYARTDLARNMIVKQFLKNTDDPRAVLVMVDNDHIVQPDLVDRLVMHNVPVVGALAFRRSAPFEPCFFIRPDGHPDMYGKVGAWPDGLLKVAAIGTGAIAIRRHVFTDLTEAGFSWPFFRYQYLPGDEILPSEDMYFCQCCEKAGIPMYCDTECQIPHLSTIAIDRGYFDAFNDKGEGIEQEVEMVLPGGVA